MTVRFESKLPQVRAKISGGLERNLRTAGELFRGGVVRTLTGGRSGRWYRVPGTRKLYQASAPGEAPASATGRLRSSIDVRQFGSEVQVGTPVRYGVFLERGTSKMRPRRFLRPGFNSVRAAIEAALKRRIR